MDHDIVALTSLSVFLACIVEGVEALTIVLAIGAARQWKSALFGAASASVLLAILVIIFGVNLEKISQKWLWIVIGSLLLLFGALWLRNALLRYSGIKALHDEDAVFKKVKKEAKEQSKTKLQSIDWYGFGVVFKGVLLEGLEIVFIVLAFGSNQGKYRAGVEAALLAVASVVTAGLIIHKPLSRVPENTLKFIVGLILTTFGTYYCSLGIGIVWPGGQLIFVYIFMFYLSMFLFILAWLKSASEGISS